METMGRLIGKVIGKIAGFNYPIQEGIRRELTMSAVRIPNFSKLLSASFFTASVLVGCGAESNLAVDKGGGGGGGPVAAPAKDLSKLAPLEVVSEKYLKLNLQCSLWTQRGTTFFERTPPQDMKFIDLMKTKEEIASQVIELKAKTFDHEIRSVFKVTNLAIQSGTLKDVDGHLYEFKFSPKIKIEGEYQTLTTEPTGTLRSSGSPNRDAFEMVPISVVESSQAISGTKLRYFDRIVCRLNAKAKPQYADQFRKL